MKKNTPHLPGKVLFKSVRNTSAKFSDGGLWMSQVFNNGEFDFYYTLEVHLWDEIEENPKHKYAIEVEIISPEKYAPALRESAMKSYCMEGSWDAQSIESQVEMIAMECGGPVIFTQNGNNAEELVKAARKELEIQGITFGFCMDRAVNGIGTTGWDLIEGNIMAGLDRYRAAQATT